MAVGSAAGAWRRKWDEAVINTTRRHLYLAGFMGTGKTVVGREVARRLGRPFIDLDEMIELIAHRRIADIFRVDGEERFRQLESHALRLAVVAPGSVIALGGGTPLQQANQSILAPTGYTVLLTGDWPTIWARVKDTIAERPMLAGATAGDRQAAAQQLWMARKPGYESMAQAVIETSGRTVADVADAVVERYIFLATVE